MAFVPASSKKEAVYRLCDLLRIPREEVGPGSTEPTGPFREACRQLGLPTDGSKPILGRRVAESARLRWDDSCDSTDTPSGGGATVTLPGLNRVLEALELRLSSSKPEEDKQTVGRVYENATRATVGEGGSRRSREIDLDELDRATQLHVSVQNHAAEVVRSHGLVPLSPRSADPQFDLAWCSGETVVVAEVKTVNETNHRQQVRLGLGQVIEYRHLLQRTREARVVAVLLLSSPPNPDESEICASAGVIASSIERMSQDLATLLMS